MPSFSSTLDANDLRHQFRGALVEAGDARWDAARQAYNLTFEQEPMLIAFPVDSADVQVLVSYAAERGIEVTPQRTGHNAEPLGALGEMILVKTDAMRGVEIDKERRVARVLAGTKWADVVPVASDLGLAALHGSTPDVSVVGYSLGGGIGWYARKHGMSANSVVAIELVTADGRFRRVDADHDAELFWALRGGGGNFGIVTAIEIQLYPISEVYAGVLFFPWERSAEVLKAWHEWTTTVPDEVTSVGRILQVPPIEEVPPFLRGQNFVIVEAVVLGDEAYGTELLRPLRELGPAIDTFAMTAPVGISELHMDPPVPVPYAGGAHVLLSELTPSVIEGFVAATGPGSGSPLVSAEIRHNGGALSRAAKGSGAYASVPGEYMSFGVGMVFDAAGREAVVAQLAMIEEVLEPVDTGRKYLNFTEEPTDPARFFNAETMTRLRTVKARVDPSEVIRANHPIRPAADATC
jgi:UDP-N-acetylenolpyruvoylglucosamine reductase